MSTEKRIPVIIDTDPGIDDAASIFWVIADGRFDIKALTITNGNVSLDKCVINGLRIVETAGRTDIPVYVGAYRPIVRPKQDAAWVHGSDGMGDAGFAMPVTTPAPGYAPVEMINIAKASVEPVTILALGPLTNVALAILLDPDFKNYVKQVLFMGGAVHVSGNDSPAASFNVLVDPEAAHIVYNSGIPLVQLGLDVCDQFTETDEDLKNIEDSGTKIGQFVIKMSRNRREKQRSQKPSKFYKVRTNGTGFNDLATTAYLINPDWFETEFVAINIERFGISEGATVADFRGTWKKEPNVHFAYNVDSRAAIDHWVHSLSTYN